MCGIVAIFRRDGAPVSEGEILTMRESLVHRGPDDAGIFLDGGVGLGHRRLKIIDLATGHQPMANERGTVHLVYNGEIYNYRELRTMLQSEGVRLRTQSDTETILGLYDLFQEDCVRHLRGMFAFILWDGDRRRLVVARDRLGIKPLYLFRRGATVAAASEIKALLTLSGARACAEETIAEYLAFRSLTGSRTMFRDVERVAPGELLVFQENSEERRKYWTLPGPEPAEATPRPVQDWTDEFDSLLAAVTRDHMVSDVPLGTFNSGGVDSSLITAYVAAKAGPRLNTYSIGFDDPAFDERPYARMVAERFRTHHHSPVMKGHEYAEWLPTALWHHDEPLNHPHSVHLAYLSRIAREKVTVVLTGEGSDELFAGYPRYRLPRILDRMAVLGPFLAPVLRAASGLLRERGRLRVRSVLNGRDGGFRVDRLAAFVSPGAVRRVLVPEATRGLPEDRPEGGARPPLLLGSALRFDQENYLQSLLNRLDKMTMSASLEGRVPFLDHVVVEFAARVPAGLKIRGLQNKFLVKQVARRYLPANIVGRQKAGFAVPIAHWLRPGGPLHPMVEMVLEPRGLSRGYLRAEAVRRIVDEHRSGRRDHGELLWGLVNIELWQRTVVESTRQPQPLPGPAPSLALGTAADRP